jgi:hypothetical protein
MGWLSQSPLRRLLVAVATVALALGGCVFYRADQCRSARARYVLAYPAGQPAEAIRAAGDMARWCWPFVE